MSPQVAGWIPAVVTMLLPSFACAQTFLVDANNGPGTQFTDLPPAIAAVPDGSVLLVRPGVYNAAGFDKGLSILATAPGVDVVASAFVGFEIFDLAAHQEVSIRGLRVLPTGSRGFWLRDCAGRIVIDSVQFVIPGPLGLPTRGVFASACAQVMLRDCEFEAEAAVEANDSHVVAEHCKLRGRGFAGSTGPGIGVTTDHSVLVFANCTVRGGDGGVLPPPLPITLPPRPAVYAISSQIRFCDDGAGSYAAGTIASGVPTPAIDGAFTTVVHGAATVLLPSGGAAPLAAGLTGIQRELPSLRTVVGPPGGAVQAVVTTPLGEAVLLAFALPGATTAIPGFDGETWLSPPTAVLQAVGVPMAGAPVASTVAIPLLPALQGEWFGWQAIAWSPAAGFRFGNPSLYTH